jgi:hypothetical protein
LPRSAAPQPKNNQCYRTDSGDTTARVVTGERSYEAEMHRIRAEILLNREPANTAAAEQSLQVAIAIAQSQKARSFELRAALSGEALSRGQSRRRRLRHAGAGDRGVSADPTIPRTHRGASCSSSLSR